ncbi:MAG: two-component regulator propeller domain-containing protein [Chryseolinea sp.]
MFPCIFIYPRAKYALELVLIFWIVFSSQAVPGQINSLFSNTFTTEQGLSQNNISAIVKDKDGFIWVGTGDGLNRFDGYTFLKFYHTDKDSTSLSNDVVRYLLVDEMGRLWVGTYNGLNLYDSNTESFKTFLATGKNPISHNTILCMMEDRTGHLWVGTYRGLNKIDLSTLTVTKYFQEPDGTGLVDNAINALFEDRYGKVWVATSKGINIIGNSGVEHTIHQSTEQGGLSAALIVDIIQDSLNTIYIGTLGDGVLRLDDEHDRSFEYLPKQHDATALGSNTISTLKLDRNGSLLVGTDGEGLFRHLGDGRFAKIRSRENRILDHGSVQKVFIDDQNNYWIGLFGAGLTFISGTQPRFEHYKFFNAGMEAIGKNSVLAIVEDQNQKIWIGTDGAGLYRFDPLSKQFDSYLHSPSARNSLTTNVVKSLLVDRENNILIGTYAGGLNYLNTSTDRFTHYKHEAGDTTSISTDHVWSLLQTRNGRIFVGQLGGVDEFLPKQGKFRRLTIPRGGLVTNQTASVFAMVEDKEGYVWMGTRLAGIHRYDTKTDTFKSFLHYKEDTTSFPSNEILDLELDAAGDVLIGTDNKGLIRFDPDRFHSQKLIPEFNESSVPSILEDHAGKIWFASFDGLHSYDPRSKKVYNYDEADGLQGLQYNEGACLKSSSGVYYFGGTNGLNIFQSDDVVENSKMPKVVFTRLTLFHDDVNINDRTGILKESILKSKSITLLPDQNVFSIEFSCLEYRFPKKNKYRYYLENFDSDWNMINENRTATYTNLPPGEYRLKVNASGNDGEWRTETASLNITVHPRWYQRLSVRVSFATAIVLMLLTIIHVRTRFLFKQKRKLEYLVKLRTELIATQKEEINDKNEKLEHAYEEVKSVNEELHRVNSNLERLIAERTRELQDTLTKLLETDKGLDTFLYRSSHDLRGPITSLLGLARVGRMQNQQPELNKCFEYIDLISNKMLRLLKKLNDTGALFRGGINPGIRFIWFRCPRSCSWRCSTSPWWVRT